jgi:hypothetical protein
MHMNCFVLREKNKVVGVIKVLGIERDREEDNREEDKIREK